MQIILRIRDLKEKKDSFDSCDSCSKKRNLSGVIIDRESTESTECWWERLTFNGERLKLNV